MPRDSSNAQAESYDRSRRTDIHSLDGPTRCTNLSIPLIPDHGPRGSLTFVDPTCPSPLANHEIWTWPSQSTWPSAFEIRTDLQPPVPTGSQTSWAFPSLPFDLDAPDRWLQDIELAPQDHLYEVTRLSAEGAEVIAWFWFQASDTWSQVTFADLSLDDLFIHLRPDEVLRFTAIEADQLPHDAVVFIAAEE